MESPGGVSRRAPAYLSARARGPVLATCCEKRAFSLAELAGVRVEWVRSLAGGERKRQR